MLFLAAPLHTKNLQISNFIKELKVEEELKSSRLLTLLNQKMTYIIYLKSQNPIRIRSEYFHD